MVWRRCGAGSPWCSGCRRTVTHPCSCPAAYCGTVCQARACQAHRHRHMAGLERGLGGKGRKKRGGELEDVREG